MVSLSCVKELLAYDDAYIWPYQFCAFSTVATYVLSILTGNVSQVDRVWTFLPTIYSAYFVLLPLLPTQQAFWGAPFNPTGVEDLSPRALVMLGITTLWMTRLSYNTYRRGLFNLKDEDYRWAVLRTQLPAWLFQIVNLSFIAIIQNILLMSLGIPSKIVTVDQRAYVLENTDIYLASLAILILAWEFTADNQQYAYQTFKYDFLAKEAKVNGKVVAKAEHYDPSKQWIGARLAWTADDAHRGFITRGLWAYSRHPNFLAEQSFWWIISLFPLLGTSQPNIPDFSKVGAALMEALQSHALQNSRCHHALIALEPLGPLLPPFALSLLFMSSTAYTEAITLKKYPKAYGAYCQRVGMFSWSLAKPLICKLGGKDKEIADLVWGDSRKVKAE